MITSEMDAAPSSAPEAIKHLFEPGAAPLEPLDQGPFPAGLCFYSRPASNPSALSTHPAPALRFQASFESGNLAQSLRVGPREYELRLARDGPRHGKWFYFAVDAASLQANETYTFHLVGFTRSDALFGSGGGCLPLFYSDAQARARRIGWRRIGHHVAYGPMANALNEFALTFSFEVSELQREGRCFFAQAQPYTYTELQEVLGKLEGNGGMMRCLLCRTIAGNRCDMVKVGDGERQIVLTARVHPGETNASFMIQGVMEALAAEEFAPAKKLKEMFTFYIVPMLNPDGVRYGRTRTSLARVDLNRVYKDAEKEAHPTIWHLKEMFAKLSDPVMFCDFHGHSTKHNVFLYGCPSAEESAAHESFTRHGVRRQVEESDSRRFARIFDQRSALFSSAHSEFKISHKKVSAGRVFMHHAKQGKIMSLTLEASQGGIVAGDGPLSGYHLHASHFIDIGYHFVEALDIFFSESQPEP